MKTTRIKKLVTAFLCLLTYASAQAQFTGSAEQYPTNDYSTVPITFSLSAVATQVGTDAGTLAAALDTWMAGNSDTNLLFLVDPADGTTLVDGYSTNAKGGFWMSSEGANTGYGADATWYEDISWDEGSDLFAFNAGQMPDTLVAGMSCSAKFALVYNEKRADFTITLNIVAKPVYEIPEPATLVEKDLNVTGEATVNMEQFPRGGYDSDVVDIVLDDLAAKLGLDNNAVFGDELAQLLYATEYNNGDVEEGGGMKKESLSNRFTAGAPGFWFRAVQNEEGIETGECSSTDWGASDAFFMEAFRFDTATNTLTCNVGQYPGSLKGGEKLFTNVYIVYGDKVYRIRYNLDIKEKEQGSGLAGYNLVGSDEVIAEQEPTDDYSPVAIHPDMDAIAEALGCEVSAIGMYALDDKDNFAGSTANNGGFWFDGAGTVTSWGATAAFFIEPPTANDFSTLNVGQYPNVLNVGDEVSANLYFINGENYFNYHVTLKIVEPTYIPTEFESVATRTFSVQTLLTTDYTCSETWNIPNEVVMELI